MPNSQHQLSSSDSPDEASLAPPETLTNCARLIADGEMEWPSDFPIAQAGDLELLVRRARRVRLVKLIAACIAEDIASNARG